jgi:cell division protein ZapA (FtsZ GTPase activity inhibitor)
LVADKGRSKEIQICPIVNRWQNRWVYDGLKEIPVQHGKRKTGWINWLIGIGVLLLMCTPLALYVWVFAPLAGYKLSETDQSWANFGSFIGGTVGPLISLGALIGLLTTIRQQQKQITSIDKNANINRIQETILKLSDNIDQRLYNITNNNQVGKKVYLHQAICVMAEIAQDQLKLQQYNDLKASFGIHISTLALDLNLLCHLWDGYLLSDGPSGFIRLQQKKYVYIITNIRVIGHRYQTIDKYFDLNQLMKICRDENCQFEHLWKHVDKTPLPINGAD